MGFLDALKSMFVPAQPDFAEELAKVLQPGETLLAHCRTIPSAYEREGSGGSLTARALAPVVDGAINAVSGSRHVGGGEGSIAEGLSRSADIMVLALSDARLSWWDFGMFGTDAPTLTQQLPRAYVASIADTGKRAQGGVPVARLTFADGSFFDYRLMSKPGPEFWAVASAYRGA